MPDLIEATEDRIQRPVAGTMRTFVFLNSYDKAELLRADLKRRQEAHAERKKKLIDNLALAKIEGVQMFGTLQEFDDRYPDAVDAMNWESFVNDPLNDVEIFRVSLMHSHPEDAAEISKAVNLPLVDKAKICGLSVITKTEDDPENPQAGEIPPTYSMPVTDSTPDMPNPVSNTG